jgi:hypothetical protein
VTYTFSQVDLRAQLESVGVTLAVDPLVANRFPLLQSENFYPLGAVIETSEGFEVVMSGNVHKRITTDEAEVAFIDFMAAQVAPMDERIAPDCRDNKHRICDGLSWSNKADRHIPCSCNCHEQTGKAAA